MREKSVAYLLESTVLCGGVKVVLRQAQALKNLGYDVSVISEDREPVWFGEESCYLQHNPLDPRLSDRYDALICTSPRLLLTHFENKGNAVLYQLIQGYEADIKECKEFLPLIDKAYSLPVPGITVSERLTEKLKDLFPGRDFFTVGQGIEHDLFFPPLNINHELTSVVIIGPLTISLKNIYQGLRAYIEVRKRHPGIRLIRISSVDTRSKEELITGKIAEYHVQLTPAEVGKVFRNSRGVLLFPSGPEEGFGLPPLEAMACGMPTVLSRIPSLVSFANPADYACFARHDRVFDMVNAVCDLIGDENLRRNLVLRGLEVASRFSYKHVAFKLEKVLGYER